MMQDLNEMALKYPHPVETFRQFLVESGFDVTGEENKAGHDCYRLSNGAIITLYHTGTILIQGSQAAKPEVEAIINEHLGNAPVQRVQPAIVQEPAKRFSSFTVTTMQQKSSLSSFFISLGYLIILFCRILVVLDLR